MTDNVDAVVVRDPNNGRFLPGTVPPGKITSPKQAQAYAVKRWADYHNAAEDGVARGTKRDTSVLGWGYIVERQSQLAVDIDKGRSSTEAARFCRDSLGLSQQQDTGGASLRLDVSGEAMERIVAAVLEWQERG